MSTVYVTHGRKYHASKDCHLMTGGEDLWDFDGEDWSWTAGSFRRTVASPEDAARCGKLPCLGCVPAADRTYPPLYGQTFGHKPVGLSGELFCRRCRDHDFDDEGDPWNYPTLWPCATAVVLGLAPRDAA